MIPVVLALFHAVGDVRQKEVNALQNKSKQVYFYNSVEMRMEFVLH